MSQTLRYIRRANAATPAFSGFFPTVGKVQEKEKLIRLDPLSLFFIAFAIFTEIAVVVATNAAPDVVAINQKYLIIGGAGAVFAPILIGGYFYDPKELGPISRPLYKGKRELFPDIALLAAVFGFTLTGIADYIFTHGGFFPTLSFWNQITPRLTFANGGVIEEFVFRAIVYGLVNRISPGILYNKGFTMLVLSPLDAGFFTVYHLWAYSSKLALDIVFTEGYILSATYTLNKWPLWVVMGIHFAINYSVAP